MSEAGGTGLRIAVDVRAWSAHGRGTDVYTRAILERWVKEGVALSLIRTRSGPVPEINLRAPFVPLSFGRTLLQRAYGFRHRLDIIGRDHDAVFLPNMAVYPAAGRAPLIVTAHDATALLHPDFFTFGDRLWHWLVDFRALMRSADRVVANSEQTRKELEALGVRADAIRVIHLGIGEQYGEVPAPSVRDTLAKYGIPNLPYFLYLGAVERRKNVAGLIDGFRAARSRGLDATLVIAGLVREPEQLVRASSDVSVLGWVEEEDKPALYTGASALVSLAEHEGFGFVPLEAFVCGTRAILSRLPVYGETIAEDATYVDISDQTMVAQALIDHRESARAISSAAVSRLRTKFSWDRCASETLAAVYEATEEKRRRSGR